MRTLEYTFDTLVEFSDDVREHAFALHCLPRRGEGGVAVLREAFRIEPDMRFTRQHDSFGNELVVGSARHPHDRIGYHSAGVVRMDLSTPASVPAHPLFKYQSPLAQADEAIEKWAQALGCRAEAFEGGADRALAAFEDLGRAVHEAMAYEPGSTTVNTTASQAFTARSGVCQDFAHIMIVALRAAGVPARYVSGLAVGEGADIERFERGACFVAGVRGDEVQQTFICARLVARLTELEQAGLLALGALVTVIPCANPASMGIGWRFWPGDKTDINRMFPGYDKGESTQRVAAALFKHVGGYQYGVHFASFYLQGDFLPHVRVMHGPGHDGNNGADFGLPYVLHHVPGSFDTTTLHYNWRLWDTEAYSLYTKETELVDAESAETVVRSVLRFLNARGIVQHSDHQGYRATQLSEWALVPVQASTGGIFCPHVQLGDVIRKGHVLATVVDPLTGSDKEALRAPCDGVVFYKARTPLVNEQTLAFQIVPPDVDETSGSGMRGNFLDPEA